MGSKPGVMYLFGTIFKKYKWNFVFVVLLISMTGFIIFDFVVYYSIRNYLFRQTFDEMRMKTELSVVILEQKNLLPLTSNNEALWSWVFQLKSIVNSRVSIIDSAGNVLCDSDVRRELVSAMDNHLHRPEVQEAITAGWGQSYRISDTVNRRLFYTAFPIHFEKEKVGFLRLAYYARHFEESMEIVFNSIIIATVIGLLVLFFGAFYLGTIVTRPILRIVGTAQRIADGDLNRSFSVVRKDEIGALNRILNQLTTRLKQQINLISDERSKLKNILTNLNVGIIAIDQHERILNANTALFHILKIEPDDVHQKKMSALLSWDPILAAVRSSLQNNCTNSGEFYYYDSSGKRFLNYFSSPFSISEDELTRGVLVQLTDITELKHLEAIRRNFVASASHELKTPLTSIIGYAETLLEGALKSPEACQRFIKRIYEQSRRLEFLVSDMLKLSKLEHDIPLKLRKIKLVPFLNRIVDTFREKAALKKIDISFNYVDRNIGIKADRELFVTVFENLIDNAIKYTPENGTVQVQLLPVNNQRVRIEVKDTGIGIDAKYHERIFQRFYRVDKARSREVGGTGLGLAIVKHIIERHGSKIYLDSVPAKGSVFYFDMDMI
ncbi:MAG TPA: HAMP domain-containing protein [bacterium]|nr:HAMP domain-containing protein [bacterium]